MNKSLMLFLLLVQREAQPPILGPLQGLNDNRDIWRGIGLVFGHDMPLVRAALAIVCAYLEKWSKP